MKNLRSYKALMKYLENCDSFKISKNTLSCVFCNKDITYCPKEGTKTLKRHLVTNSHIVNFDRFKKQQVLEDTCNFAVTNKTFDNRLVEAFAAANIPLYKLQNPVLRSFLEEYTKMSIRDESYYRKILVPIFEQEKEKIFAVLKNKNIFLLFDETTDINGRYILNIMVGLCSDKSRERAYLVRTVELFKTNADTVSQEIINFMGELYDGQIMFDKLRLILSDGAPYAVKASKTLKLLFQNLKHVTCLAHMLHRLCEKIREISPFSNSVSSELKRILVKNRENQSLFIDVTNLRIPKFPILTRWGTWLCFISEISNQYVKYKAFLEIYVQQNPYYQSILDSFLDTRFILELNEIKNISFIIDSIKELEKKDLSTLKQLQVVKDIQEKLENDVLKSKFATLLQKNPDLSFFFNLNEITSSEDDKMYLFVPLTTVDVERSFSKMTNILDDLRRGMSVKTQEILCALYFNKS
ncbi:hypothetical protein DMUE_1885 [Dictyocoela muelleri]|nr:hypothetical protein DMUE_1885 [Dictyocoela muelleri]